MRPADIQPIGEELAIKWEDGTEQFIRLDALRRACPCAECKGEVDVMGNVYRGPERTLHATAFQLKNIAAVGGYGIQPVWGDGHGSGIYPFPYLRKLGETGHGHQCQCKNH